MGLADLLNNLIKKRGQRKAIRNAEWRLGAVEAPGIPQALADLAGAHADKYRESKHIPSLGKAADYFAEAALESRKFRRTAEVKKFKRLADNYKNRFNQAA